MKPLISFILPIYNTDELVLRSCLDCLTGFTSSQFEFILIDDGSQAYVKAVVEDYCQKDSRFIYLYQVNAGVSSARNSGLTHAHAEWVFFIDSDDLLTKNAEAILLESIKKFENSEVVLFNYGEINSQTGKVSEAKDPITIDSVYWQDLDAEELLLAVFRTPETGGNYSGYYLGMPWAKLVKREILNKNALRFPDDITKREDALFAVQLYSSQPKVSYVADVVYLYKTDNTDSLSKKYDPELPVMFVKLLNRLSSFQKAVRNKEAFNDSFSIYCFDLTKELVNLCYCNQNNSATYQERRQAFLNFRKREELVTYFTYIPKFNGPIWKKVLFKAIQQESFIFLNGIYIVRKAQNILRKRESK
ncbi:hypothetical protein BAU15_06840 [Enterococcus sp. JM4C]|uniref:glycosyltransferase family 2 protein n=1 Tax=Candidatus Enterococcus huntleyi TaxID=1857217 RepID=UPI00137B84A6|nr:glycosyltransferase [Enterococcus sp. JM4C]KAF1297257.1 hypothetical protein BAU15_06840 [Enterococcus sp. JM4C]